MLAVPAIKKYVVVRYFRRSDPRTGADTEYTPETPYTGAVDKPYLLDPRGPDGLGPLIAEIVDQAPSSSSNSSSDSAGDSGKEKN